jgi:N-acetyl-anhydromuramyl-L-alanine amidase AmpD
MRHGVVVDGRVEVISGLELEQQLNYKLDPQLKLIPGEDMRSRRTRWIRSIIIHTTKGLPTKVKAGKGPDTKLEERIARLWSTDHRHAGAHLSIDWDCTVGCHADLIQDAAYHAGVINEFSIGIELFEDKQGTLYSEQLDTAVLVVEWLCRRFQIQRQMLPPTYEKIHPRLQRGGPDCVGVFGHRHVTTDRGPGDPGNDVFNWLKMAGFQIFNFEQTPGVELPKDPARRSDDRVFWIPIQRKYGLYGDGIPGPLTGDALQQAGYECGIWHPPENPNQ